MPNPLFLDTTRIMIASAAATLPATPVVVADVSSWNNAGGVVPQFFCDLWADATSSLTLARLYGVGLVPVPVAVDTVVSVTNATDNIEATAHGLLIGQGPIQFTGTDLPSGLLENTDYWVSTIVDVDNFKVATSLKNAIEGTVQGLADDGTGVMTFVGGDASEIRYMSYGVLGTGTGAVTLSDIRGHSQRFNHRPGVVAYAVSATISAGNVSASITPVRDK